jgi:hypothetical protein
MRKYPIAIAIVVALTIPASAQLNSQQQRMKDCNTQASGMSGDARKQFMSSCLSGPASETKGPHCTNGKPCGNSCIAKDKVCRK